MNIFFQVQNKYRTLKLVLSTNDTTKQIIAIFFSCLFYYLLFWTGHQYSIDGMVMFQNAKSLLFQGSFEMQPPVVWGNEFKVSIWPIGQTIIYIPVLALLSTTIFRDRTEFREIPFRAGEEYHSELMHDVAYRYSSFITPILTAATASLIYILCLQTGMSKKSAALTALVYGLASPAAVYAKLDYAQPLACFLLITAIICSIYTRRNYFRFIVISSVFLGLAILTRPETIIYGLPAILLIIYFATPSITNKRTYYKLSGVFTSLSIISVFLIVTQAINAIRFNNLMSVGYDPTTGNRFILEISYICKATLGNLISPGRGVLLFFPVSTLSILGIRRLWKYDRVLAIILIIIPTTAILTYSSWSQWGGGISWGPRFLVPVIPYIAILSFWGYESLDRYSAKLRHILLTLLIVIGWVVSLQGQLFNFLEFYGSRSLTEDQIVFGDYNFNWEDSPLIEGWRNVSGRSIDNFWFLSITKKSVRSYFLVLTIAFLLGYIFKYWLDAYLL
jgi:hypothetical protein